MEYNLKHYAHIGDAVWELYVREQVIKIAKNQKTMHDMTTKHVNAKFQADVLNKIEDILSDEEKELARRGRNLPITINKRSNPNVHRCATAFEVLIGFWYLNDKERLYEVLNKVQTLLCLIQS